MFCWNSNLDEAGKKFVERYFSAFDKNKKELPSFYADNATLIFEGHEIQGSQNIATKLAALPYQQTKHIIEKILCQSSDGNCIIVHVQGHLEIPGGAGAIRFSQAFNLTVDPPPSPKIRLLHHIFRLHFA